LSHGKREGHPTIVIEGLLRELDELRELDRLRNAHAPGSAAHDAATLEVDTRSRRLMDRFRDLKERRSATEGPVGGDWTVPLDVRGEDVRDRGSLRN
jgi:hypothetical protein